MAKIELGRIDCPICGTADGMRFTADKNGDPFGFCNATCGAQVRVGGDDNRLRRFAATHPAIAAAAEALRAAPVPEPEKPAAAPPVPAPAKIPNTGQVPPKPTAKAAPPKSFLSHLFNET